MPDSSSIDIKSIRKTLKEFNFKDLFIDQLGWNIPNVGKQCEVKVKDEIIPYSYIAELSGVPVIHFKGEYRKKFECKKMRKKLHDEISEKHIKNLIIFSDGRSYFDLSYLPSKDDGIKIHSFFKEQNGDNFINKLRGIHIGIKEDSPTISEISEKLDKSFNTEEVTKKFYEDFKSSHFNFQEYISGIKEKKEKAWYSSVILNRLMFIWFLQKKNFLDNDNDYLKTKLKEFGDNKGSYYSDFLKLLFFEGFAKQPINRSAQAKKVLGEIKYLNGGLFIPHPIEDKYGDKINIENKAFENIFKIFSKYEWHAEDNKGGSDEISPDVLGYIFEKYINDSQKKSKGAYYTRDEITNFLSKEAIQGYIVERLNREHGYEFKSMDNVLYNLDSKLCKILLTKEDSILNTLTILDPAVGSGAFLVAAMKELINIYSPIMGKIQTLKDRNLQEWRECFFKENKSTLYGIKKNIILKNLYGVDIMNEATEVCKLRLFLSLASSALEKKELEPLPNIDFNILHGNSLAGFLKEQSATEQVSLFGESYSQIKREYQEMVTKYKTDNLSFKKLGKLKSDIQNFIESKNQIFNRIVADKCNKEESNKKKIKYETIDADGKKVKERRSVNESDISELSPFHWDFVFGEIISRGGFDIILTNPPWDKVQLEDKEFIIKYDSSVKKNQISDKEFKNKKEKILEDKKILSDYINQKSFYKFQSNYYRKFYELQSGIIQNSNGTEKKSSAHMDTYRLFLERNLKLLKNFGKMGLVLPSGFRKDDGATGLRQFMFDNVKMEGLIGFQNQMNNGKGKIFEGVHPSFNFCLMNTQKSDPQDEFPCTFGVRDLRVLEKFPDGAMIRSIKEIKEQSPRNYSILEFKSPMDKNIFKKMKANNFPTLEEEIESSWNVHIYGEFHESNDKELFKEKREDTNHLPLYKGGAIDQYEYNSNPEDACRYVDKSSPKVTKRRGFAFKNKCYQDYRLVIRDIAHSTNERTLISAIIPKNSFITHTLHGVQVTKPEHDSSYLLLLQAFLNSFIVDYFLRRAVATHVSKKFLLPLQIPREIPRDITESTAKVLVKKSARLTCIGKPFDELADEVGISRGGVKNEDKRWKIQGEIDAIVAHVYGFSKKEFKYILGTFTTGKNPECLSAIKKYALEAFSKNNCLNKAS